MKKKVSRNSIGRDIEGLDLESVPGGARDVLAKAVHRRQAVLVDVAEEMAAGIAVEAGAPAQDAPVVGGLEEGLDPVLLGKAEQGVVDPREGERALVAGLERRVRGVQVGGAEVEIRAAAGAPDAEAYRKPSDHIILKAQYRSGCRKGESGYRYTAMTGSFGRLRSSA